ncbi:hypothetical protein L1049_011699 [Liquidambar formosana]|uniref:Legume lectin domain-containing protein n=1 Tax=Liquidambar formosana TaxID=63359 RepID=A0AAP0RS03_LIQFO
MATFSISRCSSPLYFLIVFLITLIPKPISTFSFEAFHNNNNNNPNFDSEISLFGDAKVVNGDSSIKLTDPSTSSSGLVMYRKPFKFLQRNRRNPTSFSTDFSFSISPGNVDGLAFVIVPNDFSTRFSGKSSFGLSRENRFLGVEFDTAMDDDVGDLNGNHVGIDVGSLVSARVSNVSSLNLVLNSGVKLRSWIDYDAGSKRLEVRLNELGSARPSDPLLTHSIDLSEMWKEEEVFVGISSSSGDSLQASSVYSWQFRAREVPNWLHSQPVDPRVYQSKEQDEHLSDRKRGICPLTILAGLIFATGCGALAAFVVLFFWAIFDSRHWMIPAEYPALPVDFRYEKINVVLENSADVK